MKKDHKNNFPHEEYYVSILKEGILIVRLTCPYLRYAQQQRRVKVFDSLVIARVLYLTFDLTSE